MKLWSEKEREAWLPKPRYTVRDWAEKELYFDKKTGTPQPGYYRADVTPYVKEPLRCWTVRTLDKMSLCWGTQLGKTTVIQVCMGYGISYDPATMLWVMPSENVLKASMKNRIWPLIDGCEALRSKFPPRHTWNSMTMSFDGGFLWGAGAGSSGNLASFPCRYIFLDETAKYPVDLNGEGDAQSSAEERSKAQPLGKTLTTSTPVIDGDNIMTDMAQSLAHERYVPCPGCGEFTMLEFDHLVWPKKDDGRHEDIEVVKKNTVWKCPYCSETFDQSWSRWMSIRGRWLADGLRIEQMEQAGKPNRQAPDDGEGRQLAGQWFQLDINGTMHYYRIRGENRESSHYGFHLNSLHSAFFTWGEAAAQFLQSKDNPMKLQVFVNSVQALPWKQSSEQIDRDAMVSHIDRELPPRIVPHGYNFIFSAVDYHGPRVGVRYVVAAFREDYSKAIIDYGVLGALDDFTHLMGTIWRRQDGTDMVIDDAVVDCGWETKEVIDYCAGQVNVMPLRGENIRYPFTMREHFEKINGQKISMGEIFVINSDIWKNDLFNCQQFEWADKTHDPPANYLRLHRDCGADLIAAFSSEKRMIKRDKAGRSRMEWHEVHHDDVHYWDCMVYVRALARYKIPQILEQIKHIEAVQNAPPIAKRDKPWQPRRF